MTDGKLTREEIALHAAIYRLHRRDRQLHEVRALVELPPLLIGMLDELSCDINTMHHAADQLRQLRRRPMPSDQLISVLGGGQGGEKK